MVQSRSATAGAWRAGGRFRVGLPWIVVCFLVGCGQMIPEPTAQSTTWAEFTCEKGGFRASFPGVPQHTTSADGKEHRYTSEYRNGKRLLRVAYEQGFDTSIPVAARLDKIKEEMQATKAETREVELEGHPGMELSIELERDGGPWKARIRYFHVGTTSYGLTAFAQRGEDAEADFRQFFASVRLIGEKP